MRDHSAGKTARYNVCITWAAYPNAAGVDESGTLLTMSASTGDSIASFLPHLSRAP